jgi:hypothetical protein
MMRSATQQIGPLTVALALLLAASPSLGGTLYVDCSADPADGLCVGGTQPGIECIVGDNSGCGDDLGTCPAGTCVGGLAPGGVCTIDDDCPDDLGICGAASGTPEHPFPSIGPAINAAIPGDTVMVVRTAQDPPAPAADCPGGASECCDPEDPFACDENVTMVDDVNLVAEEPAPYCTKITGLGDAPVIEASMAGPGTRLEGFTITGGGGQTGAGVRALFGSPTITNNVITGNAAAGTSSARGRGGGIYLVSSEAEITHNVIEGNTATGSDTQAARGGGIYLTYSSATITDNFIRDNHAGLGGYPDGRGGIGGGIFSSGGTSDVARNTITGNFARASFDTYSVYLFGYGGGIELEDDSPRVSDNVISGNRAGLTGGGISIYFGDPEIVNNTIDRNTALLDVTTPPEGFNFGGGIEVVNASAPVFFNNLITGNTTRDAGGGIDTYTIVGPISLRFLNNDS